VRQTLIALGSLLLACSPLRAENLSEVFRDALQNDPVYAAAEADRKAALEAVPQARSAFLPQLSANADTGYDYAKSDPNRDSIVSSNRSEYSGRWGYSLSLSQSLFRKDNFVILKQADISIQQAGVELSATLQDLIVRTVTAYFDILAAEDNLKARNDELEAFQRQLDQAQQRFDVGLIAITDVLEARAARDGAVSRQIAAKNELSNAHEALRRITGRYYGKIAPLKEGAPLISPDPEDIEAWAKTALEQNLDLESVRLGVDLAKQNIELAKAGHYPTLDAVASYAHNDNDSNFGAERDDATIGLQFALPLYTGGRVSSQVRQAEEEYTAALERLRAQRRTTNQEARNAYRSVIDRIAATKALKQSIISSKSAFEATEAGYDVGTRTIIDVINVQQTVSANESDYSRVRSNYVISTVALKRAAGQLSPEDVERVNTWLR
jgi:outer membrane protein